MKVIGKYTFFYGMSQCFSNWFKCSFRDTAGNVYNCTEQWMMAEKARLFGDTRMEESIMNATDPKVQKNCGRLVDPFEPQIWEAEARNIVYRGLVLKFTQNPHLMSELLRTKGTELVEASKYDKIWGIGMTEHDKGIENPKNWKGTNWLGEVLTKLRDDLLLNPDKVKSGETSFVAK